MSRDSVQAIVDVVKEFPRFVKQSGNDILTRQVGKELFTTDYAVLFEKAIEAGKRRDYLKAVELLTRLVGVTDQFPMALLYLGRSYHALGELEKAVRILVSFVRLKPESAAGYFFLGRSFLALDMYPAAVKYLREAVKRQPGLAAAHGLLGFAYLKAHRPERSVECFRNALEIDPDNKSLFTGYLNAGFVAAIRLFYRGNLVDSAVLFNEILRLRWPTIAPHLYLTAIYRELGKGSLALHHIETACGLSPDDPLLHLQKALVLMELGRKEEALEEIRTGTRLLGQKGGPVGSSPEEVLRFITIRLFTEGRYKEAIFYGTKLLKNAYDDPQLHALVAESYKNLGDFTKAKNHYLRALEKDRQSVELRYGFFPVLWRLGEHEELLQQTRRVLQANPADELALYFRSLALGKIGKDIKEVIGALQGQIRVKGPDPLLMSALGGAYVKAGMPDLAEGWFQRTLKVSESDRESLLSLVGIYESLKEPKKLKKIYIQYLASYPDDYGMRKSLIKILLDLESFAAAAEEIVKLIPQEHKSFKLKSMLALCYRKTGKYSDALILLKDLLRSKPDNEDLMKAVVYCLDKMGARAVGIQVIQGFCKMHGDHLSLILMLGVLYYQEGVMEKAVETFRRAISLAPRDWRAYRNLGMVYRNMGNREFAETFLQRADDYRKAAEATLR
jgi:tetratricopeptide (TPR) repeat protein